MRRGSVLTATDIRLRSRPRYTISFPSPRHLGSIPPFAEICTPFSPDSACRTHTSFVPDSRDT